MSISQLKTPPQNSPRRVMLPNGQYSQPKAKTPAPKSRRVMLPNGEYSKPQTAAPSANQDSVAIDFDKADVKTEKTNPYEGFAENFRAATVQPWGSGGPDRTIEGMLRKNGYSLKDIYSKDESGKTLIDRVSGANKLKNPNLIQDGTTINVPIKDEPKESAEQPAQAADEPVENSTKLGGITLPSLEKLDDAGVARQGVTSHGLAESRFESMNERFDDFNPKEQEQIGRSMMHHAASDMGAFTVPGEDGQERGMTPAEIRDTTAGWDDTKRKQLTEIVAEWGQENPIIYKRSIADGARAWAVSQTDLENPDSRKMGLFHDADRFMTHNERTIDSINLLNRRGNKNLGQEVADKTFNAG